MQHRISKLAILGLLCLASTRAHGDDWNRGHDGLLQPEFKLSHFHRPLAIDNWYSPMEPGRHVVFFEEEDGECIVNDVVVTNRVKSDFHGDYAGLRARVVSDKSWQDSDCKGKRGALVEDTVDWYGQDNAGNVWYFGEDSTAYLFDDAGNPAGTSKEGSWEAGKDDAQAGLIMLARPVPGLHYRQEFAPDVAEDEARVQKVGIPVAIELGHFKGCLRTREFSSLSPGDIEYKFYCPNLGLVLVELSDNRGMAEAIDLGLH